MNVSKSQSKPESTGHGDYPTLPVPGDARRPLVELILNMSGGPICVAALFAGASLASGLTVQESALAVLFGGLVLVVYGALLGLIGTRTGLSTGMLLRHTFGDVGSRVATVIITLTLVGWYAVQTGFFGDTLHAMFPNGGFLTESKVAAIWGGLLMLSTAYFGYRGLSMLSLVAVPLLVVLCAWGISRAIGDTDLQAYIPKEKNSVGNAITFIVGALAVGATTTSDITRYAKKSSHTWIVCLVSFLLVNSFMLLGGVATVVSTGSPDLMAALLKLGMGASALLILILGQWTTNDDNLYSSSLAITSSIPKLKKSSVVMVMGVVATALAALGMANHFVPFLMLLGVLIPPLGGVLLADHLFNTSDAGSRSKKYNPIAFASWALAAFAGWLIPIGIPTITSILTAFVSFVVISRMSKKNDLK